MIGNDVIPYHMLQNESRKVSGLIEDLERIGKLRNRGLISEKELRLQTALIRQIEIEDDTDLSPLSVLVVDDETAIRETLKEYLQHLGVCRIQRAETGKRAIEAMHHTHFDFVFMDLMMPEMGGMELLERLSQMGIPTSVVVMTGYPSMEKVIHATRYGASDFLVKPFPPSRRERIDPKDPPAPSSSQKKLDTSSRNWKRSVRWNG